MRNKPTWFSGASVGGSYFALASISILTTRFDGGLAFLWLANALLITVLLRKPRREWGAPIAWSAAGSILATGLFGVGWTMAPVLSIANMAEALIAAFILRKARSSLMPLGSMRWNLNLLLAAGIAGPLTMAAIAAYPLWMFNGQSPGDTALRVLTGHGLSNMTFIPILKLFATTKGGPLRRPDGSDRMLASLFTLQVLVTVAVFAQDFFPLLFLPILPVIAIMFHGSSRITACSLLILGVVANIATLLGKGPVNLSSISAGFEMQFAQFYLLATVLTIVPVSAQLRSNARLARRVRDSEERYRMLADHSGDVIMHTDVRGRIRFVSPSIERVGGYCPRSLAGSNCLDLIDPEFHELVRDHHEFAAQSPHQNSRFEYRARRNDGSWSWFESDCRGLVDPDGKRGVISIIRDVSERKAREQQLAVAALTDPLTGLPNRRAFRDAAQRLYEDQRVRNATLAVLDIDHFKRINDSFGHDAGDEVLQSFAAIAMGQLRADDVIARLGGEEFGILLPSCDEAAAIALCERLRADVAASVCVTSEGPVRITISGGVAALDKDGLDAALKRADAALYAAKNQGRDRLIRAAA